MREPAALPPAGGELFWLWPENVPALDLWCAVQTQWRHGLNGPTGLDYAGVRASPAFNRLRWRREERFADLLHMERAALGAWAELRAAQPK